MKEQTTLHFIEEIIERDLASGQCDQVVTRFPPEPNGYLHLGHAKSIFLNFTLAMKYGGKTNLRFDDTNPTTEETEYVNSIKKDILWLGFQWSDEVYVSDYFDRLYEFAMALIAKGLAYVDDSDSEEMARMKGTPTQPGVNSPYRNRSVEENSRLFDEMKSGKYKEGSKTLRAKIDMGHSNLLMRDPVLYRIKYVHHHRTGDQWCIYPMYDFAHGQSDAMEGVTHSLCTLEFASHRALYNWLIQALGIYPSQQYEFARLNMTYTVMSKRKLFQIVSEQHVTGWDDPRMPTISAMRRRGYPAESICDFCNRIGIAKRDNLIDIGLLEFCVREHLNKIALRRMVVLNPLKVTLTNYPEGREEMLKTESNPEDPGAGSRAIPFGRELYIERSDFMEHPPSKYFRLAPGSRVRLKSAYIIRCEEVIKNDSGDVMELRCTYIPNSKSGSDTSEIRVKGVLHWVYIPRAVKVEIRLYDRLFEVEDMSEAGDQYKAYLNPASLSVLPSAYAEPSLHNAKLEERYQFLRMGYFCLDPDSSMDRLIFNRTVTLRDTWVGSGKGKKR